MPPGLGGNNLLTSAQVCRLSHVVISVTDRIGLGTPVLTKIVAKELRRMGVRWSPSREWVRKFLHSLRLSFKKGSSGADSVQNAEAIQEILRKQYTECIDDNK